jgi:hypothetical protein
LFVGFGLIAAMALAGAGRGARAPPPTSGENKADELLVKDTAPSRWLFSLVV